MAVLEAELVASHARSLLTGHTIDVASSDRHTVKPWFNGKLDFSPAVYDLAAQGFPLQGARVDYVAMRPVGALVYRRHAHPINLFVWPVARSAGPPSKSALQGYNLLHWTRAGLDYWAVSDLNAAELAEFRDMLLQAVD
jgi:anti-sigma factor RsiW